MSKDSSIKTPLKKAKGYGSAHTGAHHWWLERLTSIALVPLVVWFVATVISLVGADHFQVVEFFQSPIQAVLMALFIIVSFYHAQLGLTVVIEDYVHKKAAKIFLLVAIQVAVYAVGLLTLAAIAKMHFSA